MTKHFSYNTQNGKPCVELGGWLLCKQIQTPSHREHQTGWDHPPRGGEGETGSARVLETPTCLACCPLSAGWGCLLFEQIHV